MSTTVPGHETHRESIRSAIRASRSLPKVGCDPFSYLYEDDVRGLNAFDVLYAAAKLLPELLPT